MSKHYIVNSGITLSAANLNDYVELRPGATVNLTGGTVTKNIWGPGCTSISGNVTVNADLGVCPPAHLLSGCPVVYVTTNTAI